MFELHGLTQANFIMITHLMSFYIMPFILLFELEQAFHEGSGATSQNDVRR